MKKIFSLICLLFLTISIFAADKPSISKAPFGELEGKQVYEYTLKNSNGMQVKILNYGATISDIITADRDHKFAGVVLGFDSLKGYTGRMNALMGAIVGRVANRIAGAKFSIDGTEYKLESNIHGGPRGFDKQLWDAEELVSSREAALKLTYLSKDGENGYPGNLKVMLIYTLTNNNELMLTYSATTDKATPVVLTNHTYFNLSGGKDVSAEGTELSIMADQYLEATKGPFPTGKLLDVKGTPFDFTSPQKLGSRIREQNTQLREGNGYDVTYSLRSKTGKLALAATAYEPQSGRYMETYTTEPGVVLYSANHLSERFIGKGGKPSVQYGAFCLETMHYPDSPNQPSFPNVILRPGQTFTSQTVFKFSARR
jgi:aldose 1-epimerase